MVRNELNPQQIRDRLHVINGLIEGVDRWDEISEAVFRSEDRAGARTILTSPPFAFSNVQAEHVLDTSVGHRTMKARRQLEEERDRLVETLRDLKEG